VRRLRHGQEGRHHLQGAQERPRLSARPG
jgi:hypothetical protein